MIKKITSLALVVGIALMPMTIQPISKEAAIDYLNSVKPMAAKVVRSPKIWLIVGAALIAQQTYVHSEATSWYNPVSGWSWSLNPFNWHVVNNWFNGLYSLFKGKSIIEHDLLTKQVDLYKNELENWEKLLTTLQEIINETPKERVNKIDSPGEENTKLIIIENNNKETSPKLINEEMLKKITEEQKKIKERKKELFNFGTHCKQNMSGSIDAILKSKQKLEEEVSEVRTFLIKECLDTQSRLEKETGKYNKLENLKLSDLINAYVSIKTTGLQKTI